ncbi:pyridoxamine 5'-phosphate oxidase family protein [Streptomyces sp. NBC_01803]|uniref:pyridoxamine 5'-phosphate oxidase family protein n=1 Tax=Streptomyces sp. NBC_01803 TaxID=2975946 RepID=UPI002DD8FCAA|nr:pyridoxamine 5'-phosphate oxidase family protein [Streptomyces sp. NBC_01803]WSA44625.1 pyridoxamine 5'-phosphate oxidase family protein [Streptomyces sp. NBC_01803]
MVGDEPLTTDLDERYSEPGAAATPWAEAVERLTTAEVFWLSTVLPDGGPHVTPLLSVWLDGAPHFTTGAGERKARNLEASGRVALTTGTDTLGHGLDIVVRGSARRVTDHTTLTAVAKAYLAKYGEEWSFTARDAALHLAEGGAVLAFRIEPETVFGFRKGTYSQTRWRF